MNKEIKLKFHNRGLRSYIEVDLCAECPRQDAKGCCGYYSPVFYASDFAYLLEKKPELIEHILQADRITVLDTSVTLNKSIDGDSYRCHFHSQEGGCSLAQEERESICRHFVCPGIDWEREPGLFHWKRFFTMLFDYEIELNNEIARVLSEEGLSLRNENDRAAFFSRLQDIFRDKTSKLPDFFKECPEKEEATLLREISFGQDWKL